MPKVESFISFQCTEMTLKIDNELQPCFSVSLKDLSDFEIQNFILDSQTSFKSSAKNLSINVALRIQIFLSHGLEYFKKNS